MFGLISMLFFIQGCGAASCSLGALLEMPIRLSGVRLTRLHVGSLIPWVWNTKDCL